MRTPRYEHLALAINDKIYVLEALKTLRCFDGIKDIWTPIGKLLGKRLFINELKEHFLICIQKLEKAT